LRKDLFAPGTYIFEFVNKSVRRVRGGGVRGRGVRGGVRGRNRVSKLQKLGREDSIKNYWERYT
jgi:hypothetical protein